MTKIPNRTTQHINRKSTQSIFRAFDYAEATGSTLNTYVVINLHETTALAADRMFGAIRHKYRDWLNYIARKGGGIKTPPIYTFTFEAPGVQPHVNWALYLPPELKPTFRRKLPRWIERVQGRPIEPFDVKVEDIKPGTHKTLAKYILKGTDPAYIDHFHLRHVHQPQGRFWGIRAGSSYAIGKTARAAASFRPRRRRFRPTPVATPAASPW